LRQWPAFYGTHPTRAALEAPHPASFKCDSFITKWGQR
jgi:hypothetical protein